MGIRESWVAVVCGVALLATAAGAGAPPLQRLARGVGAGQGVLAVTADGTVLASQAEDRAVHPASVAKVATTFALLERLPPDARFPTRIAAAGPIRDGIVEGDLIVEGGGDPFFVSENALLVLAELRALGVRRVAGRLVVRDELLFDWRPDPDGRRLERTLRGLDAATAWAAVAAARPDLAGAALDEMALSFGDGTRPAPARVTPLVVHRSPPLVRVLKELNDYSNNVLARFCAVIGGPDTVERLARAAVPPAMRGEIVVGDGAGAAPTTRLSPRAAVALLAALEGTLARRSLTLPAVLPVAGVDRGTLRDRLDAPAIRGAVVGKTGTYGSLGASALVGIVRTRRWGEVRFAVLNRGLAVPEARRRQDAFVAALAAEGGAEVWSYRPPESPAFTEAVVERAAAP
jgi:D-alanyl-D-alanine carboxypeptidase/D-alanyl-D-alanine-endopeptidase (penicillin-binding protein 4)